MFLGSGSLGCPAYDDDLTVYHHMQTGPPNVSYAVIEKSRGDRIVTFRAIPNYVAQASAYALGYGLRDWARALATVWLEE